MVQFNTLLLYMGNRLACIHLGLTSLIRGYVMNCIPLLSCSFCLLPLNVSLTHLHFECLITSIHHTFLPLKSFTTPTPRQICWQFWHLHIQHYVLFVQTSDYSPNINIHNLLSWCHTVQFSMNYPGFFLLQGLILRQEGKIQESFELFQLCNILNPSSVENIKQMARALLVLWLYHYIYGCKALRH